MTLTGTPIWDYTNKYHWHPRTWSSEVGLDLVIGYMQVLMYSVLMYIMDKGKVISP